MKIHPQKSWIRETFLHSRKLAQKVLEHLSGCSKCRQNLSLLPWENRVAAVQPHQEAYGPALDRAFQRFELRQAELERERIEAPLLVARLLGLTQEQRQILLNNSQRFRTWGVLELLIRRGKEETFNDPYHAEELLKVAINISRHLSSSEYGKERIFDLQARTWGYIANAQRTQRNLQSSEEAFSEAFAHLYRGTGDALEEAILIDLHASLKRNQGQAETSLRLLDRAKSIFTGLGETHQVCKVVVNASNAYRMTGDYEKAFSLLYQALRLINPDQDRRLMLYASNNLADLLASTGFFMRAQHELLRSHWLYQQFPEPRIQSGRRWIEAKIAHGLGDQGSEVLLEQAHKGVTAAYNPYEAGFVTREWSLLKSSQRRTLPYTDTRARY